jgi:hypothetical protein
MALHYFVLHCWYFVILLTINVFVFAISYKDRCFCSFHEDYEKLGYCSRFNFDFSLFFYSFLSFVYYFAF